MKDQTNILVNAAELEVKIENLEAKLRDAEAQFTKWHKLAIKTEEENKCMRDALDFYADRKNYCYPYVVTDGVIQDGGKRAREARRE